jgi:hypothetical protein
METSKLGDQPTHDGPESPIHNTDPYFTDAFQPKSQETLKYNTVDANVNRTLSRIEEVEEEDNQSYQLRMSHLRTPGTPN